MSDLASFSFLGEEQDECHIKFYASILARIIPLATKIPAHTPREFEILYICRFKIKE